MVCLSDFGLHKNSICYIPTGEVITDLVPYINNLVTTRNRVESLELLYRNINVHFTRGLILYGENGAIAIHEEDPARSFPHSSIDINGKELSVVLPKKNAIIIADEDDGDDDPDTSNFYFIDVTYIT